jgi:hypothetical protein
VPRAGTIAAIAIATTLVFVFSMGRPNYSGGSVSFILFGAVAVGLVLAALILRPSVFAVIMPMFLTLGFLLKFVAHNTFSVPLIEPVGAFDGSSGQWDTALNTASAGLIGCLLGVIFVSRTASLTVASGTQRIPPAAKLYLTLASLFLFVISLVIYYLNLRWNILRIGYPIAIALPFPLYPFLAFIITWGALLGVATISCWLSESESSINVNIIYAAGVLGFAASLSMGSRVQFLLYTLAAVIIVARRFGPQALLRARTLAALGVCGFLFCLSIGIVSLQRSFDFLNPSAPVLSLEDLRDREQRVNSIAQELKSLVIMRWVGLEGVMTTAALTDRLGYKLLITGLLESPTRGTDGIYQHMAGDKYLGVKTFTFLTLPGPIGVGSYSGDVLSVGFFMFLLFLIGHGVEVFSAFVTRNASCTIVTGVAMAYLTVQMGFPRTLFFFTLEIVGALLCIAVSRLLILRLFHDDELQAPQNHQYSS